MKVKITSAVVRLPKRAVVQLCKVLGGEYSSQDPAGRVWVQTSAPKQEILDYMQDLRCWYLR